MTYQEWREAVKTEMQRRDPKKSRLQAEARMKNAEEGPTASVPSPKELFETGESPVDFVANECYAGVKG
jgi:hypothetical protein